MSTKYDANTKAIVVGEYAAGKSLRQLWKKHKIPETTIHKWLKKAGVTIKARVYEKKYSDGVVIDALTRHQKGEDITSIAKAVGAPRRTIYSWVHGKIRKDVFAAFHAARKKEEAGTQQADCVDEIVYQHKVFSELVHFLVGRDEAAQLCGMTPREFQAHVDLGSMPRPFVIPYGNGIKLYDKRQVLKYMQERRFVARSHISPEKPRFSIYGVASPC